MLLRIIYFNEQSEVEIFMIDLILYITRYFILWLYINFFWFCIIYFLSSDLGKGIMSGVFS